MKKNQVVYNFILELEEQNLDVSRKISQLKQMLGEVVEENTRLKLENDALLKQINNQDEIAQELLDESTLMKDEAKKKFDIRSKENLESLYKEGFHVCNDQFGKIRDVECIFCSPMLKRK